MATPWKGTFTGHVEGEFVPDVVVPPPAPPPPPPEPEDVPTTLTLGVSKSPSLVNEIVRVYGRLVDTLGPGFGVGLPGQVVLLDYGWDPGAWQREAQIGQFLTNALGEFEGDMAFRGDVAHTHYLRARYLGGTSGGAALLPSESPIIEQPVVLALPLPPPPPPVPPPLPPIPGFPTSRILTKWPFDRRSPWNRPIGANAKYVYAGIRQATQYGMTTDVDVLILTPQAPMTPIYPNDDSWNVTPGRCDPEGPNPLVTVPIPTDFVVPGNGGKDPDGPFRDHGTTPNYSTAILMQDGVTLVQGQPFARCVRGGPATIWWTDKEFGRPRERLDGMGLPGAHGGSMLSSIGGTIRLGEWVKGGVIRHAMKLNMDNANYFAGLGGYRWPATTRDHGGTYGGSIPECRMGSLLALLPDFPIWTLETEPAKILARAFIDYGAYIVDSTGWSVYGIDTEYSPDGDVMWEFEKEWGIRLHEPSRNTPWARDMDRIFMALHVVDNWDEAEWKRTSETGEGAGGGKPRQPWAPPFTNP